MTTIVLGLTATREATAAAHRALHEARLREAEVVVVHTVTSSQVIDPSRDTAEAATVEGVARILENEGIAHRVVTLHGSAADEDIVRIAAEEEADLIVIGIRQRSAVGKAVMGSHAHRIIMDAPCPVLTVKADAI